MLTLFRLAPVRFRMFAPGMLLVLLLLALGSFDTVRAQTLTVSTTTLSYTAPQGGSPADQTVSVGTSTGANLGYTIATNATWLSAGSGGPTSGNSGNAPDTLDVQVITRGLSTGTYNGTITLTPTNSTAVATIAVTLTISGGGNNGSVLSASPSQLQFVFELGRSLPASQTAQIVSSGIPLPFSFSINPGPSNNGACPSGWLQATTSVSTTPATLTISIANPSNALGAGTCTGNVSITSNTPGNGTTTTLVGVVLYCSTNSLLNINVPSGLRSVTLQNGGAPVQFNLGFSSSDNNSIPFTAAVTSGVPWLALPANPYSGATPTGGGTTNLNVEILAPVASVLAPGTYQGTIQITSQGLLNNTATIQVTLILTSQSSVTVTPSTSLSFNEAQSGSLPAAQTVTLSGSLGSTFLTVVTTGQSVPAWLQVTPATGAFSASSPATLTFSLLPNALTQGTYSSQVAISFQSSSIPAVTIFVSLTVGPPSSAIVATPSALTFSYVTGAALPAPQSVAISNPASGSLSYNISAISDSWITVTPSNGSTPGSVSVAIDPRSLSPGSYTGSFTLTASGVSSITVNVSVFVSANTKPQPFIISNAASGVGSQLAPGEIISIKGSGLGPGTPVSFTLNSLTNPMLAGVQVTFNGFSGTLLYVSSTQINVIVPYEVAGLGTTNIVVMYQGASSAAIVQPVGIASLGLFTNNATGSGQASVLNQNYSYNTPSTPAAQGSYIAVYATGGGQTNPASTDGEVSPQAVLPLALASSVTATIGGKPATIFYAGAAPGLVTGVVQFNIQVPTGVTGSAVPIVVTINGIAGGQSQANATVAVQ
jgi:uncharacterized protein (TIGR03437 family)